MIVMNHVCCKNSAVPHEKKFRPKDSFLLVRFLYVLLSEEGTQRYPELQQAIYG
jgi:hypothetical protein